MKKLIVMLAFVSGTISTAVAQKPAVVMTEKPGWHKIGEVTADFKVDKDEIAVLGADRFKEIKLKATDAAINIYDLQVYYEDGHMEDISVKQDLKKGQETRAITLKDGSQELKKVTVIYKTVANSKEQKAHVELWGMK